MQWTPSSRNSRILLAIKSRSLVLVGAILYRFVLPSLPLFFLRDSVFVFILFLFIFFLFSSFQIIAAARFVTNETEVITMQVDLPFRMLQANDHPGESFFPSSSFFVLFFFYSFINYNFQKARSLISPKT